MMIQKDRGLAHGHCLCVEAERQADRSPGVIGVSQAKSERTFVPAAPPSPVHLACEITVLACPDLPPVVIVTNLKKGARRDFGREKCLDVRTHNPKASVVFQ